jgi:hypothetical protein
MSYSDVLDHATTVAEETATRAVSEIIKKAAAINIHGTGKCEMCNATVEPQWIKNNTEQVIGRWCSVECRDRVDL